MRRSAVVTEPPEVCLDGRYDVESGWPAECPGVGLPRLPVFEHAACVVRYAAVGQPPLGSEKAARPSRGMTSPGRRRSVLVSSPPSQNSRGIGTGATRSRRSVPLEGQQPHLGIDPAAAAAAPAANSSSVMTRWTGAGRRTRHRRGAWASSLSRDGLVPARAPQVQRVGVRNAPLLLDLPASHHIVVEPVPLVVDDDLDRALSQAATTEVT